MRSNYDSDEALRKLRQTDFVRPSGINGPGGPIPVSRSTWWACVRSRRYPRPVKLSPRITAYQIEDIRRLIARSAANQN
jgi:hypothetical protein